MATVVMAMLQLVAILTAAVDAQSFRMQQQDMAVLLAFKRAADVSNSLEWSQTRDPCSWRGITCTDINATSQRVQRMNLPGTGLTGTIPGQLLGSLAELTTLSLRNNRILGQLPGDISQCSKLRSLALQENVFEGEMPWNFSSWQSLVRLDVSSNLLNGTIAASVGELPRLKHVRMNNNSFTGPIPSFRFPKNIVDMSFAFNELQGEVPVSLRGFPASNFAGNEGLCGDPLAVPCENSTPPAPQPKQSKRSGRRLGLGAILAIVIGDIAILAVVTTLFMFCYWHKQNRHFAKATSKNKDSKNWKNSTAATSSGGADMISSSNEFKSTSSSEISSAEATAGKLEFLSPSSSNFTLEDLLRASAEMIGQGSLGTSYKAVLDDGQFVVVKRIKGIHLSNKEFQQRMSLLGKMDHENVLAPRAYYYSKSEKLIVMNYISKRSLAWHLHGDDRQSEVLDWITRLRIASDTARGLAYLHSQQFVHGNIKSSNVLLASRRLEALVVDHGLIQMLPSDASISASMAGYRAPEVSAVRKFTQQSDVFAFGVLLLEMLTGRQPWKTNSRGERIDLTRWVQSVVREEWTEEVFDQGILRFSEEEMVQVLQVALACVATLPSDRPRMKDVVQMIDDVGPSLLRKAGYGVSDDNNTVEDPSSASLETQFPADRSR